MFEKSKFKAPKQQISFKFGVYHHDYLNLYANDYALIKGYIVEFFVIIRC
jgi:hypothetical protein